MAVNFDNHPLFSPGFNSPTRFEAAVYDCEVDGKIPTEINGYFYRMACDFAYPPPKNEWATGFNGDGHVSLLRFQNGSVDFLSRYVMTDRLKAERKARRRLFGVYRNRLTDDPSVRNIDRGAANTHIYWHGGKMLTLKEDSLPYVIDPNTLETKGRWDFYGKYKATSMSAHPKIDPTTGNMICYGYEAKGDLSDDIAIYEVDKTGRIVHEIWLKAPYVGMIHDIAVTPKYVILPVVANVTSAERLKAGEPMWEWKPEYPTMVGVVRRDGDGKDVRWFKGPSRNTLHFLNATEQPGDKIHMELPVSDERNSPSQIKRWVMNLGSKEDTFGEEVIHKANGPLVRMDDRFLTLPYRYGYAGNRDPSLPYDQARGANMGGRVTNTYQRFDLATGKTSTFFAGPVHSLQECCFVPRSAKSAEGEGYLIGVASNYAEMKSEVVIVDAMNMEAGAVARVKLPFRLRSGTHTNWFSAAEIGGKA